MQLVELINNINDYISSLSPADKLASIELLREKLFQLSDQNIHPVDYVKWVEIADVVPNDYNPNMVASVEMQLLYKSILNDGFTQPVVTIRDGSKYIIVDGFHRYFVA